MTFTTTSDIVAMKDTTIITTRKICVFTQNKVNIEEAYQTARMVYDIKYCGLYQEHDGYMIYLKSDNVVKMSSRKIYGVMAGICVISKIEYLKNPRGMLIGEIGKFREYTKRKLGPRISKAKSSPVPPPSPTTEKARIHREDTILVGEDTYVKSETSVNDNYVFHAVWGASCGMWRPMYWVGPTRNIKQTKRKNILPGTTENLLKSQNHSCNICFSDVSLDPRYSNADVDHIIPLRLGGSTSESNLQIICVPCHRRKTALECRKVRNNMLVPTSITLEPGVMYIARDDEVGSICEPMEPALLSPKDLIDSGRDGLFKLVP